MEPVLYIVMRNDLDSMNAGKAMAQASHAASQLADRIKSMKDKSEAKNAYNAWCKQADGFGTVVVMETDKEGIDFLMKECDVSPRGIVLDPTYPFLMQEEMLQFLSSEIASVIDLKYDTMTKDRYGMIKATRKEGTCAWFFIYDEGTLESFQDILDMHNVKLAR